MTFTVDELLGAASKNNVSISYTDNVDLFYGLYCRVPGYVGISLTATNGAKIQGVQFVEASGNGELRLGTTKRGEVLTNMRWTNNEGQDEVNFYVTSDCYFSSMTVTYIPGSSSTPTYDYTVVLNGAPAGTKILVDGVLRSNNEEISSETKLSASDVDASRPYYSTNVSVSDIAAGEKGTITVDYTEVPPSFPVSGAQYQLRNVDADLYIQLNSSNTTCTTLESEPEALTFTYVSGKGFTVKNASNYYMGANADGYHMDAATPEYWIIEEVTPGNYTFKCDKGFMGFETNYRGEYQPAKLNYASNTHSAFFIEEYAPASAKGYSDGQYFGTYYNNISWVVPANCTAYTVSGVEDGSANLVSLAAAGEVVAANVPVLLVANQQINGVAVKGSSNAGVSPASNLLVGTAAAATVGGDDAKYYVLTLKDGNLAFCWDRDTNDEGASAALAAHKACLRVPAGGSNMLKIHFEEDDVTGIEAIATEKAAPVYNLQGQRVNATAAGIYVKNGKKFIVK